jgi:hypothetical protein
VQAGSSPRPNAGPRARRAPRCRNRYRSLKTLRSSSLPPEVGISRAIWSPSHAHVRRQCV